MGWIRRTRISGWLVLLVGATILSSAHPAPAYTSAELQPLEIGNSWTYLENGEEVVYEVVGTRMVNGVDTLIIEAQTGPFAGYQEAFTNDENGLRLHEVLEPGPSGGRQVFDPPLTELEVLFSAPSEFSETGDLELTLPGIGFFLGTYDNDGSVVGLEMVTVPAGEFEALRVDRAIAYTTIVTGGSVVVNASISEWYVAGIGFVKSEGVVASDAYYAELVSTNVPEPGGAALGVTALLTVGVVRRLRGGRAIEGVAS